MRFGFGVSKCTSAHSCAVGYALVNILILMCWHVGVNAVLRACPKLHVLQLLHCSGSFSAAGLLEGTEQLHRWPLTDLRVVGASNLMTNDDVMRLLGANCDMQHCTLGTAKLPNKQMLLKTLCLIGVTGLTNGLLQLLAAAGCPHLLHLQLEECYTPVAQSGCSYCCPGSSKVNGVTSSSECSSSAAGRQHKDRNSSQLWVPSFDGAALLQLLQHTSYLQTLRVRHAVTPLEPDFVLAVADAAPVLQMLVLDACDLRKGGFNARPNPYGALQVVQVYKCRALKSALDIGSCDITEHFSSNKHQQQQPQLLACTVQGPVNCCDSPSQPVQQSYELCSQHSKQQGMVPNHAARQHVNLSNHDEEHLPRQDDATLPANRCIHCGRVPGLAGAPLSDYRRQTKHVLVHVLHQGHTLQVPIALQQPYTSCINL